MKDPVIDLTFPHRWQAEILSSRPLILPQHHFVYPLYAEEVERGALEVLIHPSLTGRTEEGMDALKGHGFSHAADATGAEQASATEGMRRKTGALPQALEPRDSFGPADGADKAAPYQGNRPRSPGSLSAFITQPFMATCALGFRDPAVPTGLWSAPDPDEICAVAGGYAYLIDTAHPTRFTMIAFRPVLEVHPVLEQKLLLFVGHHALLAWGAGGCAWQSEKLSDEGLAISSIRDGKLYGQGWNMLTDKETPFTLDLRTGQSIG